MTWPIGLALANLVVIGLLIPLWRLWTNHLNDVKKDIREIRGELKDGFERVHKRLDDHIQQQHGGG